MNKPPVRSVGLLLLCIALPLLAGAIGSLYTMSSIPTWYATLNKPAFTPPNWVFGPVWTTLYIMMGISLYLVVRGGLDAAPVRQGVFLFAAQLVLNTLWSIAFFGMRSPFLGLVTILALIALVTATIFAFYRVSRPAAWLLVPYLCWGCFATALNAMVWVLN
ncbi:MAG: tryptophan-rich sensory protein [Methanoregula sp.]|nr:tryptophan-rich sensory protein [Methanoregula sp.]